MRVLMVEAEPAVTRAVDLWMSRRRSRRSRDLLRFCSVLVLTCLLTDCHPAPKERVVDELRIGARQDDFITPPKRSQLGMYPINTNICEPLVRLRNDYTVEPLLAERWEFRGENTWRFYLRRGVYFSDGRPLTSEAVRWSIAVAARREPHTYLDERSIRIIDDLTFDLTPSQPNQRLLDQLVHPSYGILAPGSEPSNGPIGTGPFKFAGYRRDEWIAVERNERYWGERAKLRRIVFRFLPDEVTRMLSLQAGEVDMILDVPRAQATQLAQDRRFRVLEAPVGRVIAMFLNIHGHPPFDLLHDRTLRLAVAMAIDREVMIRDVWGGYGKVVATIGPPAMLGEFAVTVKGVNFDRGGAIELLERAGWKRGNDGVRVSEGRRLTLTLIAWPELDLAALEFLQAQLRVVGIELRVMRSPDNPSYVERINSGAFDISLEAPSQNDADPIFLPALRFYSESPVKSVPFFAPGPHYDAIIARALQTTERLEVQRSSSEAMRLLIDEEVVVIPLAGHGRMYAMGDGVSGFVPHPSQLNQQWSAIDISRMTSAASRRRSR